MKISVIGGNENYGVHMYEALPEQGHEFTRTTGMVYKG